MSSERSVRDVFGLYKAKSGAGDGNRTHVRSLGSFYTAIVRRPPTLPSDYTQLPNPPYSQCHQSLILHQHSHPQRLGSADILLITRRNSSVLSVPAKVNRL
jgi:hypothetical protein